MSLVTVEDAEWRTRKVKIIEVFKSFIYQFKPGQDMTKVSLPSVLCHPFSMLEIIAQRKLSYFQALFPLSDEQHDPLKRIMIVAQYYFTVVRAETIEKKPYNPVIGEKHFCWVKHDEEDFTEFISEQVSHHPPISAYVIENKKHGLKYSGNMQFKVSFGSNYVSVDTDGYGCICHNDEVYELSKSIPDMVIRNTVWGKKYIMWVGKFEISCLDTGYFIEIEFSEAKGKTNVVNGYLKHKDSDDIIYHITGECGESLYFFASGDEDEKELLIDVNDLYENDVTYLRENQWDELTTLNVWKDVNEAIVRNDMKTADIEKIKVESEQRKRIALKREEGLMDESEHFEKKIRKMTVGYSEITLT